MKLAANLDDTDVRILKSLMGHKKKVSTCELSDELDIPDRTVRYRLRKLKEKGLLCPPKLQTYERKLGLGENLLLLQSNPAKEQQLIELLDDTQFFYYYAPTYGKYDGFMVYAMYPLVTPRMVQQLADEMKDRDLITDYSLMDMVDYTRKPAKLEPLLPDSDWTWDIWSDEIEQVMKSDCEIDLRLEEFPQTVKFDYTDIQIIKHMVENPASTLKEVGEALEPEMSLTQVHKRVKRLEDTGIIRGMKPSFSPFKESVSVSIFFKSRNHAKKILCGFTKLPFELNIAMENKSTYNVWVLLPSSEMNHLLQRINFFRKYTEDFFIQIVIKGTGKGYTHLLTAFNLDTQSWEMPISETLVKIKEIAQ
ncbi:MAG: winged helix-turn-helix transcriptional regulator [Promethearchaeota archaeon]